MKYTLISILLLILPLFPFGTENFFYIAADKNNSDIIDKIGVINVANGDIFRENLDFIGYKTVKDSFLSGDFNGDGISDIHFAYYDDEDVISCVLSGNNRYKSDFDTRQYISSIIWKENLGEVSNIRVIKTGNKDGVIFNDKGEEFILTSLKQGITSKRQYKGITKSKTDFNSDGIGDLITVLEDRIILKSGKDDSTLFEYKKENIIKTITGEFDGDGYDDILVISKNRGYLFTLISGRDYKTLYKYENFDRIDINSIIKGDYNGNGVDDISFTGFNGKYISRGIEYKNGSHSFIWKKEVLRNTYNYLSGDFNGDGLDDLSFLVKEKSKTILYIMSIKDRFTPKKISTINSPVKELIKTGNIIKYNAQFIDDSPVISYKNRKIFPLFWYISAIVYNKKRGRSYWGNPITNKGFREKGYYNQICDFSNESKDTPAYIKILDKLDKDGFTNGIVAYGDYTVTDPYSPDYWERLYDYKNLIKGVPVYKVDKMKVGKKSINYLRMMKTAYEEKPKSLFFDENEDTFWYLHDDFPHRKYQPAFTFQGLKDAYDNLKYSDIRGIRNRPVFGVPDFEVLNENKRGKANIYDNREDRFNGGKGLKAFNSYMSCLDIIAPQNYNFDYINYYYDTKYKNKIENSVEYDVLKKFHSVPVSRHLEMKEKLPLFINHTRYTYRNLSLLSRLSYSNNNSDNTTSMMITLPVFHMPNGREPSRFPYYDELKYMFYSGIITGARGFTFWSSTVTSRETYENYLSICREFNEYGIKDAVLLDQNTKDFEVFCSASGKSIDYISNDKNSEFISIDYIGFRDSRGKRLKNFYTNQYGKKFENRETGDINFIVKQSDDKTYIIAVNSTSLNSENVRFYMKNSLVRDSKVYHLNDKNYPADNYKLTDPMSSLPKYTIHKDSRSLEEISTIEIKNRENLDNKNFFYAFDTNFKPFEVKIFIVK